MKKIIKHLTLYKWIFVLFLIIPQTSFSQVKEFIAKNVNLPSSESLNKYFKKYSIYSLEVNKIANYVKINSQNARFNLTISSEQFKLQIEANDMRSEDFKAVALSEDGQRQLAQTFVNTYSGVENENTYNIVRLAIDESTFEGYIKKENRWLYIDKLNRYLPNESNDKIIVYAADDVIRDQDKKCGLEIIENEKKKLDDKVNYEESAFTGNCHFVEIATEADYEYYQAFSNNAESAFNRIRSILNLVEGLYTSAFNVKFILKYQQIWTTSADPYSTDTINNILNQFTNHWNANNTSIARDITHMFTGRTLATSAVGIAWTGYVCNTSWYYSVVSNYSPVSNFTIDLSAHELGHNFGAYHDTTLTGLDSCNGNNIMCAGLQAGNLEWSSQSLSWISNFIANSGSCMTENFSANVTINGNGTGQIFLKRIASNNITINSAGGAVQLAANGFGYIEAGTSIILTPTNPNSLGFLSPLGSELLMRISDVINTCDPLAAVRISPSDFNRTNFNNKNSIKDDLIRVNPNPFHSQFELLFNFDGREEVKILIYNTLGIKVKEVMKKNFSAGPNKLTFDCNELAAGVYIIEINIDEKKIVRKIVKN